MKSIAKNNFIIFKKIFKVEKQVCMTSKHLLIIFIYLTAVITILSKFDCKRLQLFNYEIDFVLNQIFYNFIE